MSESLVTIKHRTIIVYRDRHGNQRQHGPTSDEAASSFLAISRHRQETKVLYFVRCRPKGAPRRYRYQGFER